MKKSTVTFKNAKAEGKKLTMLTAYDYAAARLLDACDIDGILVGDSLGMVCLGYKDTLSVTMEDMIHHTKAVAKGVKNALLVADMPFMSYQTGVYDAVKNAGRLVKEAGAEAVKLEGSANVLPQVKAIIQAQIPVMGHIGLTPQSVNIFGGFTLQGKEAETAKKLIEDAKRLEEAGVFSIVLECIPQELAGMISKAVAVPTIGIGAGNDCDGQILVYHDLLGLYDDVKPKFVKVYANAGELIKNGVRQYINEVKNGRFPDPEHSFLMNKQELAKLK
ncbi:MAG: 3-methyl-2-oxobutanoate hydroxymethyltransferase [Clostridia bacterium]|nr:3-methyl-2-oxobutanoate hydroxymethyltransferase [Clostridia bacterium]MDD4798224.1 3-methyl-2-oxobutanoate hydroxymethyltransferase [Clostridia bacterium]